MPLIVFINFFYAPIGQNFISYFIKTDIASNPNYLLHEIINPEMWGALISVCISISSIIFGIVLSTKTINNESGKSIKKWLFSFGVLVLVMGLSYLILVERNGLLNPFLITILAISFIKRDDKPKEV